MELKEMTTEQEAENCAGGAKPGPIADFVYCKRCGRSVAEVPGYAEKYKCTNKNCSEYGIEKRIWEVDHR